VTEELSETQRVKPQAATLLVWSIQEVECPHLCNTEGERKIIPSPCRDITPSCQNMRTMIKGKNLDYRGAEERSAPTQEGAELGTDPTRITL